jgi:hypothetical protein
MSDAVQLYPPDVEAATRVIKRWLYGKKMAARLGRFCMTIDDLGTVDLHPETLKDIYDRGLDDGIRCVPGDIHSDPDRFDRMVDLVRRT